MTAEGANESEKIKSSGIRWLLILLGVSAVLMGAALLLKSYAPDGVYQPKPLELQQHDSLAVIAQAEVLHAGGERSWLCIRLNAFDMLEHPPDAVASAVDGATLAHALTECFDAYPVGAN